MWPRSDIFRAWALASLSMNSTLNTQKEQTKIVAEEVVVPLEKGSWICSVHLLRDGEFANSYGHTISGNYSWTDDCQGYNQVVLSLEASVSGRQFDRTGAFWIGGTELLRFTTAEPSGLNSSTVWEVEKDVSIVDSIFRNNKSWVLALDNIVNDVYTGVFIVSVSLNFYRKKDQEIAPSIVYPLSASDRTYGWFVVSTQNDVLSFNLPDIPSNTVKLQLDTFWSAHQNDEFWYFNVPDRISSPSQGIFGGGSFKELSVFIDDKLVGMDWLFPTIYSGGMNPLLWRPVVSIGTFDVPHSALDLTYALPLINSTNHNISISLGSSLNPFWFVSCRLLIWTDGEPDWSNSQNRGEMLSWNISPTKVNQYSVIKFDKGGNSNNTEYTGITGAENNYFAKSRILKSDGSWFMSETKRSIDFRNEVVNSNGNSSVVCHLKSVIKEEQLRESDRDGTFSKNIVKEYPMDIKLDTINEGDLFEFRTDLMLLANENTLIRKNSKKYRISYENSINGSGYFGTIRSGIASHKQNLRFRSPEKCYSRFLKASNRSIVSDRTSSSCNNINYF